MWKAYHIILNTGLDSISSGLPQKIKSFNKVTSVRFKKQDVIKTDNKIRNIKPKIFKIRFRYDIILDSKYIGKFNFTFK